MARLSLLCLLILALGAYISTAANDPCTLPSNSWVPTSQVLACLDSFPYNPTAAAATLRTIDAALDFYVFENYVKKSVNPRFMPTSTNLRARLANVKKTKWSTERAFHDALLRAIATAKDGHLTYTYSCFHSVSASLALPLVAVKTATGKNEIHVTPLLNADGAYAVPRRNATETLLGFTLDDLEGALVTHIEGIPATIWAHEWAKSGLDGLRDVNSAYNRAFSFRTFFVASFMGSNFVVPVYALGSIGARVLLPSKSSFTLTVIKNGASAPTTIDIPFVTYTGAKFTNSSDYYANNCAPPAPLTTSSIKRKALEVEEQKEEVKPVALGVPEGLMAEEVKEQLARLEQQLEGEKKIKGRTLLDSSISAPINIYSNYVLAYLINKNKTAVLQIPDFDVSLAHKFSDLASYLEGALAAIQSVPSAKRLILDFSSLNSGGSVEMGYALINLLFPNKNPYLPTRFRVGPLTPQLVSAATSSYNASICSVANLCRYWYGTWATKSGQPFTSPDSFFYPTKKVLVSGKYPDTFSSDVYASFAFSNPPFPIIPFGSAPPVFKPKNVRILSDGMCSSTCALVSTTLRDVFGVKTVTLGGFTPTSSPASFAASAGGGAIQLSALFGELAATGLSNTPLQPFPYGAHQNFGLVLRSIQSAKKPGLPMEFDFRGADYRIPYTLDTVLESTFDGSKPIAWAAVEKTFQ